MTKPTPQELAEYFVERMDLGDVIACAISNLATTYTQEPEIMAFDLEVWQDQTSG